MEDIKVNFEKNSATALKNANLQRALKNAIDQFRNVRGKAVGEFEEWEQLRASARRIKEWTIGQLDEYLEMLEANVIKAGGTVHWARNCPLGK